jgi:hypothetical protein
VPAATPAPAAANIVVSSTKHLVFALSPNLSANDKQAAPGGILYKLTKSLLVQPPKYDPSTDAKHICFNFTMDGWCKCSGIPSGKWGSGKRKACYRLYVSLDGDGPHSSDPTKYFVDVIWFLQTPGVATYFIPSDEFATSQQY